MRGGKSFRQEQLKIAQWSDIRGCFDSMAEILWPQAQRSSETTSTWHVRGVCPQEADVSARHDAKQL
jgi:hypothetical protein